MDLWIRSQDKEKLINITNVSLEETDTSILSYAEEKNNNEERPYLLSGDGTILGFYATKERALEVLDKIESCIQTNSGFDLYSRTGIYPNDYNKKWNYVPVYKMPKE